MAKKKRQNSENDIDQDYVLDDEVSRDTGVDEDDENEETEAEDEFAEDESDLAMVRNLENEDRRIALSAFSFADEIGFNPDYDWSAVSESEESRFVALMENSRENVEATSWKRLNVLQRWMVARAAMKNELHDMFREIALGIIKTRKKPAELSLEDIYLELARDYIETADYDSAIGIIDKFEAAFPEEIEAALRVRGLIHFAKDEIDEGKKCIDDLIRIAFNRNIPGHEEDRVNSDQRESSIQYEVGYALLSLKKYDLAAHYFDRARILADMNDDYELIMAIDNAHARMNHLLNDHEFE